LKFLALTFKVGGVSYSYLSKTALFDTAQQKYYINLQKII